MAVVYLDKVQQPLNTQTESSASNWPQRQRRRRRGHHPLTLDTLRRYKNEVKRQSRSNKTLTEENETQSEINNSTIADNSQQAMSNLPSETELKRNDYNRRQTPLIPLIMDEDFLFSLCKLSTSDISVLDFQTSSN